MSGFYSKMLINIRNLYFNNSDDMKTILHGIFLDAADVFLNGYTPSYCEENELIPTAQKFVEKFGSAKACETGVTKEAVASAMCNPAALVALMHDSDYDVLKEAFYYAWAKHISGTLADDENNGNVINDYYIPDEGSESSCDGEDSLIFGYAEPEKIVKFAESIPSTSMASSSRCFTVRLFLYCVARSGFSSIAFLMVIFGFAGIIFATMSAVSSGTSVIRATFLTAAFAASFPSVTMLQTVLRSSSTG